MKKIITSVMALTLGASAAMAGGPVVIEDTTEVVADKPATSVGVLPLLIGAIIIGAVLLNNDDNSNEN
ncbi:MAG: hypothetical protein B7Z10_12630 [Rhodobacterales bacterium 32-66-7]|nr:MAG: hypothetical protein B7Z31_07205 [Rhodobacterales bacterium 12-65-15]OYX22762.1 MAG: hypothetical protein B7Z10_12630 [Rhodobacterales bacterium 32-66-7]